MSETIEPSSLVGSELSQLDRRRSTRQILSDNHHDNAKQQNGAAHSLPPPLPEQAGDRPYQHGLVSVRNESAGVDDDDDDDDDEYCDLELERCLIEEMDGMDSSADDSPHKEDDDNSFSHNHGKQDNRDELESELEDSASDYTDNDNVEDVFAGLEWSQFVSSSDGVRRYMEGATAEILEVSRVALPSPRQRSETRHARSSDVAATGKREEIFDSAKDVVDSGKEDSAKDVVESGERAVDPGGDCVGSIHRIETIRSMDDNLTEHMAPETIPDFECRSINLALGPVASSLHTHNHCPDMHDNFLGQQKGGGVVGGREAHTDTIGGECSASNGDKAPRQQVALANRSRDSLNVDIDERDNTKEDGSGVAHASLNVFVGDQDMNRREDDGSVVSADRLKGVKHDGSREDDKSVVRTCRSKGVSGKSSPSRVQSVPGKPNGQDAQPGWNDEPTSTSKMSTFSVPDVTVYPSTPTTSRQAVLGSPPAQQGLLVDTTDGTPSLPTPTTPCHAVRGIQARVSDVGVIAENGTERDVGAKKEDVMERLDPESQAIPLFEADRISAQQQEIPILHELKEARDGFSGEVPPSAHGTYVTQNTAAVVASVQEEEVERRIQRDKTGSVEKRRHQMAIRLKIARQVRSALVFQSVWRGRSTRAHVSQARATRRRELEETNRMFQEQQLATRVAALEAKQKEEERRNRRQEQSAMRDEDERASNAWKYLARREKNTRAEELARMRAEERYTRALLDLERQDAQRVDRARREAAETVKMKLEDLATQELRCLEKAQAMECGAMAAEDALARKRAHIDNHRLAVSRSERHQMAVEDRGCSVWNVEHRLDQENLRAQARARSTPIQRAMDPRGIAAARRLICTPPPQSVRDQPGSGLGAHKDIRARSALQMGSEQHSKELVQEWARRRECYKGRLGRILVRSLNASSKLEGSSNKLSKFGGSTASSKCLGKHLVDGINCDNSACHHPRESSSAAGNGGSGHTSSREGRAGPAERDGEECDLTADMLSHLGPLEDLAELDLCVEGLTSASLLRECTSLKSLSLNVNRLSSPAGLVASTTLVRLGLRDNRLTSLRGLSGLPNLRELRLDINHLTSLHELASLPSLVELSANSNHIRKLPEGFSAALMTHSPPNTLSTKSLFAQSTKPLLSSESAVTCGGLQKLELYHNRIESVHPRALDRLTSLTHLDLGRNQLNALDGRGLESCPALSTLVLSQNLLREPPSPLCLPLLSELWLSGNQISHMGAWAHAPLPQTPPSVTLARQRCTDLENSSSKKASSEVPGGSGVGLGRCPRHQEPKNGESNPSSALEESGSGGDSGDGLEGGGSAFAQTGRRAGGRGRGAFAQGGGRGEGGRSALAQGGTYADDGSVAVWLPTLEVLHLQDNCLETLGGRWSLAGCPLLRSFDASFNRLRDPDEIARCLQACGDIREVRLHDNPASACPNYADTIALSCPRLVRADGVAVDTAAHWRAAAKTYGRRADAVLPFLLSDATEPSRRNSREARSITVNSIASAGQPDGAIDEQTGHAISDHTASEPNASHLDIVDEPQQCPWCGDTIFNDTHAERTASRSEVDSRNSTSGNTAYSARGGGVAVASTPAGGSTAGQLGGERDTAPTRERGTTPPNSNYTRHDDGNEGRLISSNLTSIRAGDGGRRKRYTCASCRGELPDTDLWCVQDSRDNRCTVRWGRVLAEGRRWRAGFCPSASRGESVKTDNDEVIVGDAFERVCLAGRDERASMRRRHRREERGVASRGHADGAQTRTGNGASSSRSAVRSGSSVMTTSRRRLETELNLELRHAKERGNLAARQLRFHASGGGVCDARSEGENDCVVIELKNFSSEKGQAQHVQSCDHGRDLQKGANLAITPRRRDQAVRIIQRLWHRRHEQVVAVASRAGGLLLWERGLNVHMVGQASERAVTKLQSAFRGFHIRRALQAALDSARYVDEEVEGVLSGNGGVRFELNTFLAPPPELADDWWGDRNPTSAPPDGSNAALHGNPSRRNAAAIGNLSGHAISNSTRFIDTTCAVIGSTPLSARANFPLSTTARSQRRRGSHDGVEMGTPNGGGFDAGGGGSRSYGTNGTTRSSAGHGAAIKSQDPLDPQAEEAAAAAAGAVPVEPFREAPATAQESGITQDSRGAPHEGQVQRVSSSHDSGGDSRDRGDGIGDHGPVGAEEGLVRAWGLSDPTVARAMMKRAKRLRKFQNAEARREKLREPEARFNAFARKAGGHRTLRSMSDLSRRDIDQKTIGLQPYGAAEAKREQASPAASDGPRVVRRRLAPVVDDAWARGETSAMSPRAGVLSSSHVHLQHHHDGNQTHHKANSSSSEDHHPTAARPPSTSSSCSARPWPPPKPHHHHHYHHHGTRPPPQPNSHPRENTRETHGGDLSRQSSGARGGRGGLSRHLSGVRGSRSRPRATLRAVELGAEAVMGDANWVGYGVRG